MAYKLCWLSFAIHHQLQFTRLDHQSSHSSRRQRPENGHKSDLGHTPVFQVESVSPYNRSNQMKNCIKKSFNLCMLVVAVGVLLAGQVTAQTFTTVYNLSESSGVTPVGLLVSG